MSTPKRGDRVRVQLNFEAEVTYVNGDGSVELSGEDSLYADYVPASAVSVIAPPVKVGDVLDGPGQGVLDQLPVNAALSEGSNDDTLWVKQSNGAWRGNCSYCWSGQPPKDSEWLGRFRFTVRYLPEPEAK